MLGVYRGVCPTLTAASVAGNGTCNDFGGCTVSTRERAEIDVTDGELIIVRFGTVLANASAGGSLVVSCVSSSITTTSQRSHVAESVVMSPPANSLSSTAVIAISVGASVAGTLAFALGAAAWCIACKKNRAAAGIGDPLPTEMGARAATSTARTATAESTAVCDASLPSGCSHYHAVPPARTIAAQTSSHYGILSHTEVFGE
jgi:hypothetical protein